MRQPDWPILTAVLRRTGPLTGTSANRAGTTPCCTAEDVQARLGADVDLIVDGGRTPGLAPSTLVDAGTPVRLVREGAVPRGQIREVLCEVGVTLA